MILSLEWSDKLLPDFHYASLPSASWLAAWSSLCGNSLPIHPATPYSSCHGGSPMLPLPPFCSIQRGCYGNCSLTPGLFVTVTTGLTWIFVLHPVKALIICTNAAPTGVECVYVLCHHPIAGFFLNVLMLVCFVKITLWDHFAVFMSWNNLNLV